jgi:Rrf2 family protein
MIYSKSAEYAIQAMIYLTEKKPKNPVMIHEIAKEYNIPSQYLSKIMQNLVKYGFISTTRGRNGGVMLAKSPKKIFLNEIVASIDGPAPTKEKCVIGLDLCSDTVPCPLHDEWKPIRHQMRVMLETESLEHLTKIVTEKREKMIEK